MLPCTCDVGMCTHRPNCRQHRAHVTTDKELNMARSDHSDRDKLERINRLRERIAAGPQTRQAVLGIIKGILDLLADEL